MKHNYTRVHYMYRDADNYKAHGSVLLEGILTQVQKQQVTQSLDPEGLFIPAQVGWPHLGTQLPNFPGSPDHCWHELDLADCEVTTAYYKDNTIRGSVKDWVAAMTEAKTLGWDDSTHAINEN